MVLTRRQFIEYCREYWRWTDFGDDSPMWIPESNGRRKSRWFVCVRPIELDNDVSLLELQQWNLKNCRGQVLCYSSGEHEEWWGFTHKKDVAWWLLRWGHG
jgi:hypothetical protein